MTGPFRVIPHMATNNGPDRRFGLHSWLCAKKRPRESSQCRGHLVWSACGQLSTPCATRSTHGRLLAVEGT